MCQGCLDLVDALLQGRRAYSRPFTPAERRAWAREYIPRTLAMLQLGSQRGQPSVDADIIRRIERQARSRWRGYHWDTDAADSKRRLLP